MSATDHGFHPLSTRRMPPSREEQIAASLALGAWMAAALDDPSVCAEMKRDINRWFDASMPASVAVKEN